ncbi:DinB family protein [Longimicrobium sp.]|jgi:hypothetical protein|uniref:DinB family protein n=1 Tax=Longimicrobium sp. TaxID=2029185 RepID=UPI002ED978E7
MAAADLSMHTAVLERTPGVLRALLLDLPFEWADGTEGPGSWSPAMVVEHMAGEERANWIPRARSILQPGGPRALPAIDRVAPATRGDPRALAMLLDEFSVLRRESLSTVASWTLTREDLEREGEHPEFGRVTLGQLLATWVAHDLSHLAQIARVMAKRQREAVGPWRAYLPIMDR